MSFKFVFPFVFCFFLGHSQDSIAIRKSNPILFSEGYLGYAGGSSNGFALGAGLNYQFYKKDLLTLRVTALLGNRMRYAAAEVAPFPDFVRQEVLEEYALLYGKRYIFDNFSLSFSGGISLTNRRFYEETTEFYQLNSDRMVGFPFEVNIKWFKSEKDRFRAYYGLIPIGKRKVSFGRSIGFKLIGNVSKTNYTGIGITYGFGFHKKY